MIQSTYNNLPFVKSFGISFPLLNLSYEEDYGIGDIKGAYRFIDLIEKSGASFWQLPSILESSYIHPYDPSFPISAFALEPLLIDIMNIPEFDRDRYASYLSSKRRELHENKIVNYVEVKKFKDEVFGLAFEVFYEKDLLQKTERANEFNNFVDMQADWLLDYALYMFISLRSGKRLGEWDDKTLKRKYDILASLSEEDKKVLKKFEYIQWIIHTQWLALKEYAHEHNVSLIGALPFYVHAESVDVWQHSEYFQVDSFLRLNAYGGMPTNKSYKNGALWECPLYLWKNLEKDGYDWVIRRIKRYSEYFDGIKLNHFRGFVKYWKIVEGSGKWEKGPGVELVNKIMKEVQDNSLKFIYAEVFDDEPDEVKQVRYDLGIYGHKVFSSDYEDMIGKSDLYENIACSSSLRSDTLYSWWESLSVGERRAIFQKITKGEIQVEEGELQDFEKWKIIEEILYEPSPVKVFQLQDLVGEPHPLVAHLPADDQWTLRLKRSIESLLSDNYLIEKLNLYSDIYSMNSKFRGYGMRVIPEIHDQVLRKYKTEEEVTVWCLSEFEDEIFGITNAPLESDMSENIKELQFEKVAQFPNGVLYQLRFNVIKAGEFTLSVTKGKETTRSFDDKFDIVVAATSKKGVLGILTSKLPNIQAI